MHSFAPPRPPMQPQITTVTELSLAPESQFCKREYRKENCICVLEVSALRSRIRSHLGNSDLWQNPDALDDGYGSRREVRAERHCSRKRSANQWFKSHTIGFPPIKQPPRFASSSPRFWVPQKNRAEKSEKACDAIGGALRPQRREWSGAATLCRHTTLTVMCRAFRQAMSREPSTLKE